MTFELSVVDLALFSLSSAVDIFVLVASLAVPLTLPSQLSTRARNLEAGALSLVATSALFTRPHLIALALAVYLFVRFLRKAPGERRYLVPTALFCALYFFIDRAAWVGVCLSPLACALLLSRPRARTPRRDGDYGQSSSSAAAA
jgi:hypothetical protein